MRRAAPLQRAPPPPHFSGFSAGSARSLPPADLPPLPPPGPAQYQQQFPRYGMQYSGMGQGGLGFSPYSSPYNNNFYRPPAYGASGNFSSDADQYYRQTFSSIEGVVSTFQSISWMMESSYQAIYSSFRAMVGLAEHMGSMKSQFLLGLVQVFRFARWCYQTLASHLHLRTAEVEAWREVGQEGAGGGRPAWPMLIYLALVLGVPYLLSQLVNQMTPRKEGPPEWLSSTSPVRRALYSFSPSAAESGELEFSAGEVLRFAPRHLQTAADTGWLIATDGKIQGFVPRSYFQNPEQESQPWRQDGLVQDTAAVVMTPPTAVVMTPPAAVCREETGAPAAGHSSRDTSSSHVTSKLSTEGDKAGLSLERLGEYLTANLAETDSSATSTQLGSTQLGSTLLRSPNVNSTQQSSFMSASSLAK